MYFEINVSKDGLHYFATHERSITTVTKAVQVASDFFKRFPESEGFSLSLSCNPQRQVSIRHLQNMEAGKLFETIQRTADMALQ